jgi:glycine C-acetyltransferase
MPARVIDSAQGAWLTVDGRAVLNLCSNNYLGFATAPELKAAAKAAVDAFGVGAGGARSISGTQRLHVALEQRLAEFKGVDAAMLLSSGFLANLAVVPALVGRGDRVYSDELNHASIVDACRLSGAEIVRYPHADAEAMLVVDDAHGEGVVGSHGRGIVDHFGVRDAVTAEVGTLSKAFGVVGGYVCGSASVIDQLRSRARPYLFSTGLSPADTAAALAAVSALAASDAPLRRLWDNARFFRATLVELGLQAGGETPIVPVMLGDEERAHEVAQRLFEEGIFVVPIVYPMVPRGSARIRVMLSAEHTTDDLRFAAQAFAVAVHGGS